MHIVLLSCDGIPAPDLRCFELIASVAGQPEVLFNGSASPGFGNDVFDGQPKARYALWSSAIATTMAGRSGHAFSQLARHASSASTHCFKSAKVGMRCPRYLSNKNA